MSKALLIDDEYGKLAADYYAKFPDERISKTESITIDATKTIPKTSLKTLLETIKAECKSGDNLVIVSHGAGSGMVMKLISDSRSDERASTGNLNILMGSESAADKASRLGLSEAQVTDLLSLQTDCGKLKLGHMAFRGCTIGKHTENLDALKSFLGAKVVSGTDLYSTFGYTNAPFIEKREGQYDRWMGSYRTNSNIWNGGVSLYSVRGKDTTTTKIGLFAKKKDLIPQWLQLFVLPSVKNAFEHYMEISIPIHYMDDVIPILPQNGLSQDTKNIGDSYVGHVFTSK